jgi:hypothetical protein
VAAVCGGWAAGRPPPCRLSSPSARQYKPPGRRCDTRHAAMLVRHSREAVDMQTSIPMDDVSQDAVLRGLSLVLTWRAS